MKSINGVILVLLILAASPLFAQSDSSFGYRKPQAEINTFVKEVTGAGSLTTTVQAADGGYVTASKIDDTSFLVRKIKATGQKQWERRLNFQVNSDSRLNSIIAGIAQTTDAGFILVGGGCSDPYFCSGLAGATLVKILPNGTVAWKKSLAAEASGTIRFFTVIATPDGGFITIGENLDVHVLHIARFTPTGDVVWEKRYGTFPAHSVFSIPSVPTTDNGVVVAITAANTVDVIKVNESGDVLWAKTLRAGGLVFRSVGATADGGAILVGTGVDSNKLKVIVLKANGTVSWKAGYFLKVPGDIQFVSSPVKTRDGGYVLTGTTNESSGKRQDGFIAKIDSSRNVAFQNIRVNGPSLGESVFETPNGGFFLFGSKPNRPSSDLFILKVDSEGRIGCGFFQPLGAAKRALFGLLKIGPANITTTVDLSLEPFDFGLSSVVTNHPVTNICN
jgi:hypothetical protein